VLILWTSVPKPVQALPAAIASVVAGLVGPFRWLDAKTRYAYTAEALGRIAGIAFSFLTWLHARDVSFR
jgi:hypothetical protein